MDVKILGSGCAKCNALERAVRSVVERDGLDATVSKVEDITDILSYGVMITPALVIDENVVVKGRVPSDTELTKLLNA